MRKLIVCTLRRPPPHASCGASGGVAIAADLEAAIAKSGLSASLERRACLGACLEGPNIRLFPEGRSWRRVTPKDVPKIIACLSEDGELEQETWT